MLTLQELHAAVAAELKARGLTNHHRISVSIRTDGNGSRAEWSVCIDRYGNGPVSEWLADSINVSGNTSDSALHRAIAILGAMLEPESPVESLEQPITA